MRGCGVGSCYVAMYSGVSGTGDADDVALKMGRILLRFRPIAPKPAVPGSGTIGGSAEVSSGCGRSKRKSGGSGVGGRGRKEKKVESNKQGKSPSTSPSSSSSLQSTSSVAWSESFPSIVTLSLMPETPERKGEPPGALPSPPAVAPYLAPLPWLQLREGGVRGAGLVVPPRPVMPAGSWVTVEGITETWHDSEVTGADGDVWKALEVDTCPAFITDHWDRVTWTNKAYRKMVIRSPKDEEEEEDDEKVRVGLVTRVMLPASGTCRGFTCRVRVKYACRRRGKVSLAAPCDVWRLDCGRWAWRLDVKAALSLGVRPSDEELEW